MAGLSEAHLLEVLHCISVYEVILRFGDAPIELRHKLACTSMQHPTVMNVPLAILEYHPWIQGSPWLLNTEGIIQQENAACCKSHALLRGTL